MLGFFEGAEVFSLEVFDEGEFRNFLVAGLVDDDGDVFDAEAFDGSEASFAGDEFVFAVDDADDEGLDESAFAYGVCKFANLFVAEFAAGLKGGGLDVVGFCLDDALAAFFSRGSACFGAWLGFVLGFA